jgi:hypothetical protein
MKRLALISVLIILLLQSCNVAKRTIAENKITQKETLTSTITTDSTQTTTISKPIQDRVIINVPPADNEATKRMVDAVLKQLNTSKISGQNYYASRYDAETRQLIVDFMIAQTKNQNTSTSKAQNTATTFEEQTDTYIKKKVTSLPWWFFAIIIFLFRKQLFGFILDIFPQLNLGFLTRLLK